MNIDEIMRTAPVMGAGIRIPEPRTWPGAPGPDQNRMSNRTPSSRRSPSVASAPGPYS